MRIPVGGQLRQMVTEKLRFEGDDRLMSQFSLNFLDLDGPHFPPYWLSLAHVRPCWLCVTCATPVGLRALGLGIRHLFCTAIPLLGSATTHEVFHQETGQCRAEKSKVSAFYCISIKHTSGSFVHIRPFFILICYFPLNNGQSCFVLLFCPVCMRDSLFYGFFGPFSGSQIPGTTQE